jgi:hypothetical protein
LSRLAAVAQILEAPFQFGNDIPDVRRPAWLLVEKRHEFLEIEACPFDGQVFGHLSIRGRVQQELLAVRPRGATLKSVVDQAFASKSLVKQRGAHVEQ